MTRTLAQLVEALDAADHAPPARHDELREHALSRLRRAAAEAGLAAAGPHGPVSVTKGRLARLETCERLALTRGDGGSPTVAQVAGQLVDGLIGPVAVGGAREDYVAAAHVAAELTESQGFDGYRSLDPESRRMVDAIVEQAGPRVFGGFPAVEVLRRMRPVAQDRARLQVTPGLVISGRFDLTLDRDGWPRPVVVEVKSGEWRDKFYGEMRFYALLYLLREGVLPSHVVCCTATGDSDRIEEVTADVVETVLYRVTAALPRLAELAKGAVPAERSNGLCRNHCPALPWCPTGQAWIALDADPDGGTEEDGDGPF